MNIEVKYSDRNYDPTKFETVPVATPEEIKAGSSSSPAHGSGALTWSAEKPKRRGWWWVEMHNGEQYVARVEDRKREDLSVQLYGHWNSVSDTLFRRWAGPLVEPVEASAAEPLPNAKLTDESTL